MTASLSTLCSDVLCPTAYSLSKVSLNFYLHILQHKFLFSLCLFTYFPLSSFPVCSSHSSSWKSAEESHNRTMDLLFLPPKTSFHSNSALYSQLHFCYRTFNSISHSVPVSLTFLHITLVFFAAVSQLPWSLKGWGVKLGCGVKEATASVCLV